LDELDHIEEDTSGNDTDKLNYEVLYNKFRFPQPKIAFTQHDFTLRAADYFAQARKPRAEWKKLDDLAAQLAEFDLRCEAGDYDTACSVLRSIDFDYLLLWGHYRLMIDLHLRVKDKLQDEYLIMGNLNGLGLAHRNIGRIMEAISYYEIGASTAKEKMDIWWERPFLGNLGNCYQNLGDARKATEFHEQSLDLAQKIRDRKGEAAALSGLGTCYTYLGDSNKSISFHKQALVIDREIHESTGEGIDLSNIAGEYSKLGDYNEAIDYYNQALQNAREIGNKYGESKRLNGLAEVFIEKGDLQNAIKYSQESLQIGQEISSPEVCIESTHTLAATLLFSENLKDALQVIQDAGKYDRPDFIFNVSALHGIIALRQGERETAQEAFTRSIAQADEILARTPEYYSALDAKGLALCGAALAADDGQLTIDRGKMVAEAVGTFRKARKIAPHAGVIKSLLRLFDELVKCDEEGILKDVRKAVEGRE
jgi:tetratricopeptide (TPR) repeat protein